jgi:hypothetical protein
MIMKGVTEYCEGMDVELIQIFGYDATKRYVIKAMNECGYNHTEVDLLQLISWVKKNKPELL